MISALAIFAGAVAMMGLSGVATAQRRIAFVAGTDKYDNLEKTRQLQRAVNDARAVGAAFKNLGFEVLAAENLTRGQFNALWQKFLDSLNAGDTAAIYYAGHGVEIEGLNFLLPRDIPDIKFGRQEQIKRESVSVAELLLDLRSRSPEVALIILDACRDNPLIPEELRSVGGTRGGLAPLKGEPPKGTFIMYSAGAGESALDRLPGNDPDRENSIFARKLLPLLGTKGLALHDLARQLRADVLQLASTVPHTQRPAYYDGVIGRYCLAGCESAAETTKRIEPATIQDRVGEAARVWETLRNSANLADLEAFAGRYGDTYFAGIAKTRIDDLKRTQAISKSYTFKPGDDKKRADADAARKKAVADDARDKAAPDLKPGSVFRDCTECPEMVVVPAGEFMMGSPVNEDNRSTDEGPRHKVTIAVRFAVGKFEVTFAEWDACVAAGGCTGNQTPNDQGWGRGKRPAINVSWDDAAQYVAWLSSKTGNTTYRLLTEAEWEFGARAGTSTLAPHTLFATGPTISADEANYNGDYLSGIGKKGVNRGKTIEVGSFSANAFGLHDMHGNVFEWVQDCYKDSYDGAQTDGSAVTSGDCGLRVLRGGSWIGSPRALRSAYRYKARTDFRRSDTGFRVARSL
jgi:formylglycine-generating enzyme required for sulfatase activity